VFTLPRKVSSWPRAQSNTPLQSATCHNSGPYPKQTPLGKSDVDPRPPAIPRGTNPVPRIKANPFEPCPETSPYHPYVAAPQHLHSYHILRPPIALDQCPQHIRPLSQTHPEAKLYSTPS